MPPQCVILHGRDDDSVLNVTILPGPFESAEDELDACIAYTRRLPTATVYEVISYDDWTTFTTHTGTDPHTLTIDMNAAQAPYRNAILNAGHTPDDTLLQYYAKSVYHLLYDVWPRMV